MRRFPLGDRKGGTKLAIDVDRGKPVQLANMSEARHAFVASTQVGFDLGTFRRRFDDEEGIRHLGILYSDALFIQFYRNKYYNG